MRIACPSCNAVYRVPDEELGEGRVVRCVRCGTDWSPVVQVPADEGAAGSRATERPAEALPEPALTSEPEMPVRRMALDEGAAATVTVVSKAAAGVAPRRAVPWLAIAWVVSIVAVVGGVAAVVVGRERVMEVWPPSVRAYAAVGLATKP